jgi:hypothetical protein
MPQNKNKTDVLHDMMPKGFKTRHNPNWAAILKALGESDQAVADLLEAVRKQFFIKTAERPYVDKLGSNVSVVRPSLMGMQDPTFKQFIPVMSYQPKQVKAIIDQLLDVFFFKETISAFTQSDALAPYYIRDGWELTYQVDGTNIENMVFAPADFVDSQNATAEEVAAVINRQAQYSFAVALYNPITKTHAVRLFTKTIGSKGSIRIVGGRADIALQFKGYNHQSQNGADTVWHITQIGDETSMQYYSGTNPHLELVQAGDIIVLDMPTYGSGPAAPTNVGSFVVKSVDIADGIVVFNNLLGQAGSYDHAGSTYSYVRFFTPEKAVIYTRPLRAISWEVRPGEIVVEVPATPPVDRPNLIGAARINGLVTTVTNTPSQTQLTLSNISDWPVAGGRFVLQGQSEIKHHIHTNLEDIATSTLFASRFDAHNVYTYTSIAGNTLSGITPNLPVVASIHEIAITTATRNAYGLVTVVTSMPHGLTVNQPISVSGTTLTGGMTVPVNGCTTVVTVISATSFTYVNLGDAGIATGGLVTAERPELALSGSTVYLTSSLLDTGILGPYIWDTRAPFVISSITTELNSTIQAGDVPRSIQIVTPNAVPDQEGYLVFDLGTSKEEGPVKYTSHPNSGLLMIDPTYIFQLNHSVGTPIIVIRRKGAQIMSGLGIELAPYITNPNRVREILHELILQVKSVGIFLDYMVRYPEQFYATLDVYNTDIGS